MKSETEKIQKKRALFIEGGFMLSNDSINNDVINTEFQAIDQNLNLNLSIPQRPYHRAEEDKRISGLVSDLLNGHKIILGSF